MPSVWPKTILCGQAEWTSQNGCKAGFHETKSPRVFGHPSQRAKTPFRVGLYARVSTQDQQTIPLQTRALREYVARRLRIGRTSVRRILKERWG
jgi:hypothetical protein